MDSIPIRRKGCWSSVRTNKLLSSESYDISFRFFPTEAKSYKNEAVLSYDNMEAYVPITGTAHNGNVYLSKSYIQMDEAYIGL